MAGSSIVGTVTRIEGSSIREPRSISARNEAFHSLPKWMLWWATPGGSSPATPACQTKADGEYRPRRGRARCLHPGKERSVRDGQVSVADNGRRRELAPVGEPDAADRAASSFGEEDPRDRRVVSELDAGLFGRAGQRNRECVHAAHRHVDTVDASM